VEILKRLKLKGLTILTNNPEKISALEGQGFSVTTQSLEIASNKFNKKYLETKRDKLNHALGAL
jgi:3,4-dihydroxy 2-butanone 4-phosphate synthase/GTP cyclohydrolase II